MRNKKEILDDIRRAEESISALRQELREAEKKKTRSRSNTYKKRKALLEKTAPIIAQILKPGMTIKVIGSKAGPYKEVFEVNKHTVAAYQMRCSRSTGVLEREPAITNHGINKIVEVYIDGEWKKAKEFLDGRE